MKTIAIGLTLLLMGNMSFAQKAKEVSHKKLMQKIERETVRPSQITNDIKKKLIQFLSHPRRDYPAEKLKNGEYRFYFLTHCRDMYIDINAENRVIFVRDTSFSSSDQEHELAHYIKGPRYLPSLYIKDGPVYIQ